MKLKEKFKKFAIWMLESKRVNFEMSVLSTFMFFWLILILATQLQNKLSDNALAICTFGATYLVCRWRVSVNSNMSYTEGICDGLKENLEKIRECQIELSRLRSELEKTQQKDE